MGLVKYQYDMKSTFITIALVLLLFGFYLLPATTFRAGMMGAWWACVLWQANDMNIKLIRYAYRKKNKSTPLSDK